MSYQDRSKQQRSSNIFGPPVGKDEEMMLIRHNQQQYRQNLEKQLLDNAQYHRNERFHEKEHPLETRVERYKVTMKRNEKKHEEKDDEDGQFVIGSPSKSVKDVQLAKQQYQDSLTMDMLRKKEYLEHKEEMDMMNRKPYQRNISPTLSHEFVIGADSIENERLRRENAIAFSQGNAPMRTKDKRLGTEDHSGFFVGDNDGNVMSKKERMRMQYKQELDDQVNEYERMKRIETDRQMEEDKRNARMKLPYSGDSDAENKRKEAIMQRQEYLQRASVNFPAPKERYSEDNSNASFSIGEENRQVKNIAKKQADYKKALDQQMDYRTRVLQEEKESARREDEQYARQNVPYFDNVST